MKLLFGCGYLGTRVARLWRDAGRSVTIVTRSEEKAAQLRQQGFTAIVADVCDPASLADLPPAETVLFAVGYDRSLSAAASRTIGDVYAGGVRNVLNAIGNREWGMGNEVEDRGRNISASVHSPSPISRSPLFVYISSTGVYGDAEGDWVDESTVCSPQREGGRACLAAEAEIAAHPLGARAVVLRLAGIYGPGRIPRAESLRRGEPIDAPADGYLNLIHVDDAARIVLDVESEAENGRIALPRTYCVADGRPPLRRDYYAELARLLDAPSPQFVAPPPLSPAAQRAAADKRISNARLVAEIKPTFLYPSHREGLAAIVGGQSPAP